MRLIFPTLTIALFFFLPAIGHAAYQDEPGAKLRWLDKVTARTGVIELGNDESAKYGDLVIRVKACRTQDPLEGADSAAFLQVWENKTGTDPEWVYSGWMFSSSPGMAAMDHPVYDVWVLGCIGRPEAPAQATQAVAETPAPTEEAAPAVDTEKNIEDIVEENASATPEEAAIEDEIPFDEEAAPENETIAEKTSEEAPSMITPEEAAATEPDYDAPFNGYKHLQKAP